VEFVRDDDPEHFARDAATLDSSIAQLNGEAAPTVSTTVSDHS
jgi:hypothetical protein